MVTGLLFFINLLLVLTLLYFISDKLILSPAGVIHTTGFFKIIIILTILFKYLVNADNDGNFSVNVKNTILVNKPNSLGVKSKISLSLVYLESTLKKYF